MEYGEKKSKKKRRKSRVVKVGKPIYLREKAH